MGFADELAKAEASNMLSSQNWQRCAIARLHDALEGDDRAAFDGLIIRTEVTSTKVVDFLRRYADTLAPSATDAEGVEQTRVLCSGISSAVVQRHRRGNCSCKAGKK